MNKKILFRAILLHWRNVIVVYTVAYFVWAFCIFDFYNPFKWILNIPYYSTEMRAMGLFIFLFVSGVSIGMSYDYLNTKK